VKGLRHVGAYECRDSSRHRLLCRQRLSEEAERQEEEAMLDLYKAALGMQ
jgi:uncharacterized protein (UPF0335 family)